MVSSNSDTLTKSLTEVVPDLVYLLRKNKESTHHKFSNDASNCHARTVKWQWVKQPVVETVEVARIALRLPPFWKSNVRLWIAQCDHAFTFSGISSDDTKYSALVTNLDAETLSYVSDIVLSPPNSDKYHTLSQRLITQFSDSETQKIKKLLTDLQLGDEKPSHLLRKMKELSNGQLQDDFLQSLWLQRMPPHIQTVLSASSEPLDKLAIIADKVAEVVGASSTICAATTVPPPSQSSSCSVQPTMECLVRQIQELSLQVAELTRERNSSRHQRYSSDHRRSHSRSRSVNRGSGFCYYHRRYKEQARKCVSPCAFVQKNEPQVWPEIRIDSGSEICVIPPSPTMNKPPQSNFSLFAANNTKIPAYGMVRKELNLGLRRPFIWTFIIADVSSPIIGADFLKHFNLLIDLKKKRSVDVETSLFTPCVFSNIVQPSILTVDANISFKNILLEYPDLSNPSLISKSASHGTVHHIITTGTPVTARPRRLHSKLYDAVKVELNFFLLKALLDLPKVPGVLLFMLCPNLTLQTIFQRLSSYGLKLNISKCVFGVTELIFLGHLITPDGIKPLPDKVQAVLDYKQPETVGSLRKFLGLLNFYRRFLPKAAEQQYLLSEFLKGSKGKKDSKPLNWSSEAITTFQRCKQALVDAALLAHPSPSAPLALHVDASDYAIGGALHQVVDSELQPLAFFSRKLTSSEKSYSVYDRELLAIYSAIRHFRYMLEARDFTVFTDHKPLIYAFRQKSDKCSPRQIRQLDFISQFTTNIVHIPGSDNIAADVLSRVSAITFPSQIDYDCIAETQQTDQELHTLIAFGTSLELKKHRQDVFSAMHNLSHPGIRRSVHLMKQRFVWPSISSDVAKWARHCLACQKSKIHRHTRSPLSSFQEPSQRFDHVHLDLIGPLPPSNGYTYCLTMIDRFSKWPEAQPLKDITAEAVAEAFFSSWVSRFGTPAILTTDRGRQFESSLFKALSKLLGVQKCRKTGYHPQANGMIEELHHPLKSAIKWHATERWTEVLPIILLGLRASLKEDILCTPAELVFGTTIRLPGEMFDSSKPDDDVVNFVSKLKSHMQSLHHKPPKHHGKRPVFIHPGLLEATHVFLRRDMLRRPLQQPYDGPLKVLQRKDKVFFLDINGKRVSVSIDRCKPAFFLNTEDLQLPQTKNETPATVEPNATSPTPATVEHDPTASTPTQPSTRSGRKVHLPTRYR
ncbi:transposon Tf2-8 polyprotein [Trichonephila clavipes]|nr:transposon Tf2-8 polyprotein [Trichonephila clavipes]